MEKNIKIKLLILFIIFLILLSVFISAVESEEKQLCQKLYFSVVQNGYNLPKVLEELTPLNFSEEDISEIYFSHYELCVLQNYTKPFPQRTYTEININDTNGVCNFNDFFFDYTFYLPDISIGELSCKRAKLLNYFFKLEETNSYSATKIRIWWGILLIFGFLFILAIRQNSWLNKLLEKSMNDHS